jgi:Ca2+-binding EF-hand superfamily protein
MTDSKLTGAGDWAALQRKIFTRWVNQKLTPTKIPVTDVVNDFADGVALAALVEVLSETKIGGKPIKPTTTRVQQIDNAARALAHAWAQKVHMEVPCSAENVVDKNEKQILGLVWAIMIRFLKFNEDEAESLSAEEALLMWVKNQVAPYKLDVTNFTKSFHDGKVFAALIHKNRPRLIHPDNLKGSNEENIAQVFEAAHKYFGLEKYLEPSDIAKLDNKSAFIFVSEFYYGIANQRKLDLAARRISKLIDFTKTNDALREEYKTIATREKALLAKVNGVLGDRTVDNTLAGAKAKLEAYYAFKKDDKTVIVSDFLKLEALYNHLAMRLADNNRPKYEPGEGLTVEDFRSALVQLEKLEQERGVELVQELNRQLRLVQINTQHQARFDKIKNWVSQKETYLRHREVVESSGAADYQLNRLASYDDEAAGLKHTSVADLKALGAELLKEKYEHSDKVSAREAEVDKDLETLAGLSNTKNDILTDDLARNRFKESIHLVALKHSAKHASIKQWIEEKKAYLNKKETVNSVNEAQLALSVLDSYEADRKDLESTPIPALKQLGEEILSAKYESAHSKWEFERPDEIKSRESEIDSALAGELTTGLATKRKTLEDDLARELEKERLRLLFANQIGSLVRWAKAVSEDVAGISYFGSELEAVESYQAKLDKEDKDNLAAAEDKKAKAEETYQQAVKLGVTENPYTDHKVEELAAAVQSVQDASRKRAEVYAGELSRVRGDDALAKEFAAAANPVVETINKNRDSVNESKAELAELEKLITGLLEAKTGESELKTIQELQGKLESRGVTTNKHSHYTAKDVEVRLEQYNAFLNTKLKQVKDTIALKSSRGITTEQLAEIEKQFVAFDKNNNKVLDAKEFKACLYSLGEERSKEEVAKILAEFGDGKALPYEGFKKFMIKLFGDTNTKDEILGGFKLLAHDEPQVTEAQLAAIFPQLDDVEYLKQHASKEGEKLNYTGWTDAVFAR